MKKINLTILCFMTIIFLTSCATSSHIEKEEVIKVQESWKTIIKWIETQSNSTWFINK
jgi:hypothetical protein